MTDQPHITRRSAFATIGGALASTTAMALTAAPAAANPIATLDALIERHREAYAEHGRLVLVESRIEETTGPHPRVMVSHVRRPSAEGYDTEPVYAYTVEQIDRYAAAMKVPSWHGQAEKAQAWRLKKRAEFEALDAEQRANLTAAGFEDARAKTSASFDQEKAARIALLMYRPQNEVEAAIKWAYVTGSSFWADGWHQDGDFVDEFMAALNVPLSNA